MTAGSSIDYDALTQEALRGVVRKILMQVVARGGLPGEHHFYIAFNTQAPDVVMSRRLKEKYPDEMMIVLQHRFWDLAVTEEAFEVKLTFDGIPERLYVPFESIRVFFDPSVRFTLQFGEPGSGAEAQDGAPRRRKDADGRAGGRSRPRPQRARTEPEQPPQETAEQTGEGTPSPAPAVAPPTVFAPRPVAVPSSTPSPAESPAKEGGGAKVFSLDQFRKK